MHSKIERAVSLVRVIRQRSKDIIMSKIKEGILTLVVLIFAIGSLGVAFHFSDLPLPTRLERTVLRVVDSVVHISNNTQGWQGSGVIISNNLIMTARHVVNSGEDFTITFNCGKKITVNRAISSEKYDIGFIWVEELMPKAARLGSIKDLRLGQGVFAVGSPFGKLNFNSLTSGIVSGLNRDWEVQNVYTGEKYGWEIVFTTDSAGHPGNSGCPVFTMDGVVRGILVGGYSPVLNCIVPVDLVLSDIKEIEQMFVENEYYIEEAPEYDYSTEYY